MFKMLLGSPRSCLMVASDFHDSSGERDGDIPSTSSRKANMSPRRQFAAEFSPTPRVIVVVRRFHEGNRTEERRSVWAIPDFDKQPPRGEGRSKESGNKRGDGGVG